MFRKREKKRFPPGTFIPTLPRVAAIIQLCIAFSAIFWYVSQPFLGDLFRVKSKLLVYHDAMGIREEVQSVGRQERNRVRFESLPKDVKDGIVKHHDELVERLDASFGEKLWRSGKLLIHDLPLFLRGWLFLGVCIPLLLLLKVEGAAAAMWLLPVLSFSYSVENRLLPLPSAETDAVLFPTEQVVIDQYLGSPLKGGVVEQQQQLKRGWDLYLASVWSGEEPSNEPDMLATQAEEGEFHFTIRRLESFPVVDEVDYRKKKDPFVVLALFLGWNILLVFWTSRVKARNLSRLVTQ